LTAVAASSRAFYLPPAWLAIDDGERLDLLECGGGDRVELTGVLRTALMDGERPAALAAMARCDATLARFVAALDAHPLRPLDRAALLRGSGFGQLFVELTARCNERCVHCYADSSPEREEALDEATLLQVLEDGRALGFPRVQLTGGDPLISPLCALAAERARALGYPQIEVYTNGLALGERLLEQLAAQQVAFAFSFYSADPAVHDAITRTPGSQRRTLSAIERVLAAGSPTRVSIIAMDQNHEQLDATRALVRGLGVAEDAIHVDVQRSVGRGLMTITPKTSGITGAIGGHRQEAEWPFEGRAAVSYDGTVFPCIFSRAFPLGSVHQRRLLEILNDPLPLALDFARILREQVLRKAQLSCWDCRVRGAVLAGAAPTRVGADP
jgi:MoaA/NifB/PqqE/SkfB family radical SAM enzyme